MLKGLNKRFLPVSAAVFAAARRAVYPLRVAALALSAAWCAGGALAAQNAPAEGEVNRLAPDFVRASLLLSSPGNELFTCVGHAFLRLECPTYGLDYCFSYESEPIPDKLAAFFSGRLKMGMFAQPTEEFLRQYRRDGRGVTQYRLELPPAAKQRLWKLLDAKVAEGQNLPYDYLRRGCASATLGCLREALAPEPLALTEWPEKFETFTRREFFVDALEKTYPWNLLALQAIVGTAIDARVPKTDMVIVPGDLLAVLQRARVRGRAVAAPEGEVLVAATRPAARPPAVTPALVAGLVALLSLVNALLRCPAVDWLFLALQTVLGVYFTYMVVCSNLPATGWNWQLVPFNVLPAFLWRFRRYWAFGFAVLLLAWEVFMLLYPHNLTDPAFRLLTLAYVVFYLKIALHDGRFPKFNVFKQRIRR